MSYQERQNMKEIDRLILDATPEDLAKFQDLDMSTQLDGKSFYDTCTESRIMVLGNLSNKSRRS